MAHHDYTYDVNRIIYKASELGNGLIESYALDLDNMLANNEQTPEMQNFLDKTVEFLYEIMEE